MALVSISTDMQGEEAIVHCAAEALGDLALPAVVTAPGRAEQLRREHPDIRIEEFAPHDELLVGENEIVRRRDPGCDVR